jgi:hypothetical protein
MSRQDDVGVDDDDDPVVTVVIVVVIVKFYSCFIQTNKSSTGVSGK